jgi:CRP-like cAMP-binding protein
MWDNLYKNIERYVKLSNAEKDIIKEHFVFKKLRKRQYLLQEGEIIQFESYVIKGCLRTYEVDASGQEHVLQFAVEDWWTGDLLSFLSATPSRLNIDCLDDCEVLVITKESLEKLYAAVPKLERYFRILIQRAYIASQYRLLSTIGKSAVERYEEFLEKYPAIEQRVPNHQIASFLGITPESLSRIRKQILSKKS